MIVYIGGGTDRTARVACVINQRKIAISRGTLSKSKNKIGKLHITDCPISAGCYLSATDCERILICSLISDVVRLSP